MNKKGFYDEELEKLMNGGDSTAEFHTKTQSPAFLHREARPANRASEGFGEYGSGRIGYDKGFGPKPTGWVPNIHGENEVEGFGGWFFRDNDQSGRPVIRLVVEQMDDNEATCAEAWYGMLGRLSGGCFLHRSSTSPIRVEGKMVFDFEINSDVYSLGEQLKQKKLTLHNPDTILRKLNGLILKYQKELKKNNEPYRALNCLTLNTVFADPDNNLMVLPVYYHGRNYPIEIAREAMIHRQTDERSDVYAAAYVAVEAFSDSNGDKPLDKPESEVVLACLQVVKEWRPTPDDVEKWFCGRRPTLNNRSDGTPFDAKIQKPDFSGLKQKTTGLMKYIRGFEGREPAEDTDDTNKVSRESSAFVFGDDSDDSEYDYGRN